jgi:hypothetical protein
MKCLERCREEESPCTKKDCRMWIEYEEDYNCISESINKNGNMTLRETAARLKTSFVRIKQIEAKALAKLGKRLSKFNINYK